VITAPLKRAGKLIELLGRAHRNGLVDTATRIRRSPRDKAQLTNFEIGNLLLQ